MPILKLLFARDRGGHVGEHLKMNQPVDSIFGHMAQRGFGTILRKTFEQIRRYADVDRAVELACKDINARVFLFSHGWNLAAKWTLKQVQGDDLFHVSFTTRRHPELVSGYISRFAPLWWQAQVSQDEFLGAVK